MYHMGNFLAFQVRMVLFTTTCLNKLAQALVITKHPITFCSVVLQMNDSNSCIIAWNITSPWIHFSPPVLSWKESLCRAYSGWIEAASKGKLVSIISMYCLKQTGSACRISQWKTLSLVSSQINYQLYNHIQNLLNLGKSKNVSTV